MRSLAIALGVPSLVAGVAILACGDSGAPTSADQTTTDPQTGTGSPGGTSSSQQGVPAVFKQFNSTVEISRDGDYVVLRTNNVPDHKSAYFSRNDSRYEAYNGSNSQFMLAPGTIQEEQLVFRIPVTPQKASVNRATPLGPIGIALNGVALFNQYNGQSRPLTVEINTFDQWNGHPTPTNEYHYHVEPTYITRTKGSDALVGFLLDGFPVYGPTEGGKRVTNADLDQFHGHVGATKDYPGGIYHYHITAEDPYINGAGFYGTAGTVGR